MDVVKGIYEKALGSLAALAIGDAMGMPVEMLSWEEINEIFVVVESFERPPSWHINSSFPPGKVTDDTELSLLLARTLIRTNGNMRADDFAEELRRWAKSGALSLTYIGPATKEALKKLMNGIPPRESGGRGSTCGAAIRVSPVGIVNACNFEAAALMAVESSLPTHGGRPAISGASAIASAVAEAMKEDSTITSIVNAAILGSKIGERFGRPVPSPSVWKRIELAAKISRQVDDPKRAAFEIRDIIGTGMQTAEAVPAAIGIFAASKGDPMEAIHLAVNLGGDTDSVASMAGAISGAWKGIQAIDKEMLRTVEEVNGLNLEELAMKLAKIALRRLENID
ncbi:MAG: hypothetical protein DRN92_05785 [Thermoproteota archaeon]|nr:MAG: hypothetical protein DRN92_05785 [Candidatus Korarchaeota archaeon]